MSRKGINFSNSPLLASKTPVWRSKLVVGLLALGFAVLALRATYIQVIGNDFFQNQGQVRFARTLELPANRGRILDRNGLILASSVEAKSIWAIPDDVNKADPKLAELARLLDMPLVDLRKRLTSEDKNFVWVRRLVDEPVAKEIAALKLSGVHQSRVYKRQYPEGESAAHLVGFTNVEDRGQEGIELAFNKQLSGKAGSRRVIKDRLGRVVEDIREVVPPVDGQDLVLSIDSKIQYFAYQKLADTVRLQNAKAGSVVVLDSRTGEVLALANYPSFNPNRRIGLSGEQLRNRALTDSFEPGSTMKPFVAALAMDRGLVKATTPIQTAPGRMMIGGSTINDAKSHGVLTLSEVIQKSSNVGTVKVAMQMHPREMWESYAQAGFGQKPQLPFPGAVSGRLRPYKSWRPIEQATMSYGYGLSASLFQLAQAYTVFANGGELLPVSLTKSSVPAVGVRVFSPASATSVRNMLHMAASSGGTAPQAQTSGYSVGGKTGTARKQVGKHYVAKKYRTFFVGLAPIEDPRIVVAVMIDEPNNGTYFAGVVAGPVFSETVQQTLRIMGVKPDLSVKPQIVMTAVEETL